MNTQDFVVLPNIAIETIDTGRRRWRPAWPDALSTLLFTTVHVVASKLDTEVVCGDTSETLVEEVLNAR